MAHRRSISTNISKDKRWCALASKSDFAALLYILLLVWTDDDATAEGDPEQILYEVIPGMRNKTEDDVREALDLIAGSGLLEGVSEGRLYFHIESYYEYQSYITKKRRRTTPMNAEHHRESPQNPASLTHSLTHSHSKARSWPACFDENDIATVDNFARTKDATAEQVAEIGRVLAERCLPDCSQIHAPCGREFAIERLGRLRSVKAAIDVMREDS